MSAAHSYIAVSEKIEHAGTILMWSLHGPTDLVALRTAWLAQGLNESDLPEAPSPATALRRAVNTLRGPRMLVRPLGRDNGYAVVREIVPNFDEHELQYDERLRVRLDKVCRPSFTGGSDSALRALVDQAFVDNENSIPTEDMSAWLVGQIPSLDGVSLRSSGGVYFIPFPQLPRLEKMVAAIRASTPHVFYRVPAIHESDDVSRSDVVRVVLDSIEAEARAEAEAMERDLEAASFGSRGYENRIERTDAIEQKVGRYESLLGGKLDSLRERLMMLRANLAAAVLKADAEEAKRGGGPSLASL